jgi:hypothetical protein
LQIRSNLQQDQLQDFEQSKRKNEALTLQLDEKEKFIKQNKLKMQEMENNYEKLVEELNQKLNS